MRRAETACALVLLTLAAPAGAERVRFRVEGGGTVFVYSLGNKQPFAKCHGSCLLEVIPGTYRVVVAGDDAHYQIDERVSLAGVTHVDIDRGDKGPRWALKGAGAAGICLAFGMFVLAFYSVPNVESPNRDPTESRVFAGVGFGMLLAGLTAIGASAAYGPSVNTWTADATSHHGAGTALAFRF